MHSRSFGSVLAILLLAGTALGGAGPRIIPGEAGIHRAQLVTVVGPVTEVQDRAEGMILRLGAEPSLPVLVPSAARARFRQDLTALHRRRVEVTGFITPHGRPLALVLERPELLVVTEGAAPKPERELLARLRAVELELARVRSALPSGGLSGITYGPVARPLEPLPPYPLQPDVLAYLGVPTRVEWGLRERVLVYGDERWTFDVNGQLMNVQRR